MRNRWRNIALVAAGVIAGSAIATSTTVAVEAGAGGTSITSPTWYGCVSKAGALSKVGTVAPTCRQGLPPISWNSYPASANGTPQCTGIPHSGIDLSGCSLEGLYLANGYLYNSDFAGAYLLVATFSNANLVNVNFAGANLGESTMTGADLNGANLSDTNLALADFNGTNLTNADLKGATGLPPNQIGGVTWSNTTCPDGSNSNNDGNTCINNLG
jgi:uncharacterized protein YjbI with pentapeptide repeats